MKINDTIFFTKNDAKAAINQQNQTRIERFLTDPRFDGGAYIISQEDYQILKIAKQSPHTPHTFKNLRRSQPVRTRKEVLTNGQEEN